MVSSYTDLDCFDRFTSSLEKIECLLSLALDREDQHKHLFTLLVMVSDHVAELRRITTDVATGGAR
jgi:hypothetical protein